MSQFDAAYRAALLNPHIRVLEGEQSVTRESAPPLPAQDLPQTRYKSKTEQRFVTDRLECWIASEVIRHWSYEPCTFWLAHDTSYTPDFVIQRHGDAPLFPSTRMRPKVTAALMAQIGEATFCALGLLFFETKASRIYERGRAFDKLKMTAHLYPMCQFRIAQWSAGAWRYQWVPSD